MIISNYDEEQQDFDSLNPLTMRDDIPIWRLFLNQESISRLITKFPKAYDIDFNPLGPLDYYSW